MSLSGGYFFLIIAVAAGVAMAFQGALNSALHKIIGLWEATFWSMPVQLLCWYLSFSY